MTKIRKIPENIYNQYVREVRNGYSKGIYIWLQTNYPKAKFKEIEVNI